MSPILAAVLLLLLPAGLEGILRRWPRLFARLDRVAALVIVLLLVVEVVPSALAVSGWGGALALLGGLAVPSALERVGTPAGAVRGGAMLLAQLVLLAHAAFDGLALSAGGDGLVLPVLLHQVPVGLGMWVAWRGRYGLPGAALAMLGVAGATVLGWGLGNAWVVGVPPATVGVLQSLVAGSLAHVAGHGVLRRLPVFPVVRSPTPR